MNDSAATQAMTEKAPLTGNQASIMMNLEQMIKNHVSSIDRISEELKKQREMLKDTFENDEVYRDHSEKAKEAVKVKAATKAQIMKQPQVFELSEKIKNIRSEVKELKAALSDYLKEFERISGVNEIEGEDGEVRKIEYTAKLVKLNSRYRQ